MGLVGDVGDLADCLWAVLTLADTYDVDLGQAFNETMAEPNRGWAATRTSRVADRSVGEQVLSSAR